MKKSCVSIISMVVEEATRQFSPLWKLNERNFLVFKEYCKAIDNLSDEFDGTSFSVDIDEIKMTTKVTLTVPDLAIGDTNHLFYKLVKTAQTIRFSVSENNELNIEFTYPSLWERA